MKNTRVLSTLLIAGSLALTIPFAAQARPGGMDGCHHAKAVKHGEFGKRGDFARRGGAFMHGLDLTEAQRDRIFEVRHAAAPTLREKGKEAYAARKALREASKPGAFDEAKVREASAKLAQAQADLTVERLRVQQQMYAVLTPEQRTKVEQAKERRGKHFHGQHHLKGERPAQQS